MRGNLYLSSNCPKTVLWNISINSLLKVGLLSCGIIFGCPIANGCSRVHCAVFTMIQDIYVRISKYLISLSFNCIVPLYYTWSSIMCYLLNSQWGFQKPITVFSLKRELLIGLLSISALQAVLLAILIEVISCGRSWNETGAGCDRIFTVRGDHLEESSLCSFLPYFPLLSSMTSRLRLWKWESSVSKSLGTLRLWTSLYCFEPFTFF